MLEGKHKRTIYYFVCVVVEWFFLFSVLKNQPKLKMKEWQQSLKYNKGTAEKKFSFLWVLFCSRYKRV